MPYLNHIPANNPSHYHIHKYLSSRIPFLINSSRDSANILIRFYTYYSIFLLFMDSCSLWILFLFFIFLFYKLQHSILYLATWFISYPPIYFTYLNHILTYLNHILIISSHILIIS